MKQVFFYFFAITFYNSANAIVNGYDAKIESYPWQVKVGLTQEGFNRANCGGVVIHKKFVLTASHCIGTYTDSYSIYGGSTHQSRLTKISQVKKIYDTADYKYRDTLEKRRKELKNFKKKFGGRLTRYEKEKYLEHDLVLLELKKELTFNSKISKVHLFSNSLEKLYNESNQYTFVTTGWGGRMHGLGAPNVLQGTDKLKLLPMVDDKSWGNEFFVNDYYPDEREQGRMNINYLSFAADKMGINFSACVGDSGGPMIVKMNNENYLVGITSFVGDHGCSSSSNYASIPFYYSWITTTISQTRD